MKTIAVSKFKATCLSLLETVRRSGQPLLLTKNGEPLAQVLPPPPTERKHSWIGSKKDTLVIKQEIVSPVVSLKDWLALKK